MTPIRDNPKRECDRDGCGGEAGHPLKMDGGKYCCYRCAVLDNE